MFKGTLFPYQPEAVDRMVDEDEFWEVCFSLRG
jgi:hypothetical protein